MELFLITETTILTMLDILPVAAILLFFSIRGRQGAPAQFRLDLRCSSSVWKKLCPCSAILWRSK